MMFGVLVGSWLCGKVWIFIVLVGGVGGLLFCNSICKYDLIVFVV